MSEPGNGGKPRVSTRRPKSPSWQAKRDRLAVAVAEGMTVAAAAAALDLDEDTAARWLHEPEVAAKVKELRESFFAEAHDRMRGAVRVAIDALLDEARSGKGADRVKAAIALLDRVGYGAKSETEHTGMPTVVVQLGADAAANVMELRALTERARAEKALTAGGTNERSDEDV